MMALRDLLLVERLRPVYRFLDHPLRTIGNKLRFALVVAGALAVLVAIWIVNHPLPAATRRQAGFALAVVAALTLLLTAVR